MKYLAVLFLVCLSISLSSQEEVIDAKQINVVASLNSNKEIFVFKTQADYDTLKPNFISNKRHLPIVDFTKNNLVYVVLTVLDPYIKCEDIIIKKFTYKKNNNELLMNFEVLHFGSTKAKGFYFLWYIIKKLPENTTYKIIKTGINYDESYIKTDTLCNYFEKLRPKSAIIYKN